MTSRCSVAATPAPRLIDLFDEAAELLRLTSALGSGCDVAAFSAQVVRLVDAFERQARTAGYPDDAIEQATFAFIASVDETVLRSPCAFRDAWRAKPMQLIRYNEQLAGERFFERLDAIRQRGAPYQDVAEVFHLCLSLGFEGKYARRTDESLHHLVQTLGIDITRARGAFTTLARRAGNVRQSFFRRRIRPHAWIACAALLVGTVASAVASHQSFRARKPLAPAGQHTLERPGVEAWVKITIP